MGSHSVIPATWERRESRLYPQPKQIPDLATLEGCKAELTYEAVYRSVCRANTNADGEI